jgi:hypothetical protein
MRITTVGLDREERFQVHGVDGEGQVLLRRRVRRDEFWRCSED